MTLPYETAIPTAEQALEEAMKAARTWHQGGVGMHTNDGRWTQKRMAETETLRQAIKRAQDAAVVEVLRRCLGEQSLLEPVDRMRIALQAAQLRLGSDKSGAGQSGCR